jgi:prepilin-type processing-associated H-X9-DG protein/prepilin-type N-terminal cleavage/methylation domain-containing protein
MKTNARRSAFTVVELLVVIAIIGILVALLLPAIQAARQAANRMQCTNNLKQLAQGVISYHEQNDRFPRNAQYDSATGMGPSGSGDQKPWSWIAKTLPFIEQKKLYEAQSASTGAGPIIANGLPLLSPTAEGKVPARQILKVLNCPSNDKSGNLFDRPLPSGEMVSLAPTSYKGVGGSNWSLSKLWTFKAVYTPSADGIKEGDGIFWPLDGGPTSSQPSKLSFASIYDGTQNTLMIGEDLPQMNDWCSWPFYFHATGTCAIQLNVETTRGFHYPPSDYANVSGFRSNHPGGANFAYADGHVTFVPNDIDLAVYRALATRGGRELVPLP